MSAFLLFLYIIQCTFTWTNYGHEAMAELAQRRLNNQAQKEVHYYLQDYHGRMIGASTWADRVIKVPKYKFTAAFHYSDTEESCDFSLRRDCPHSNCVITAVSNYTQLLLNRRAWSYNDTKDFLRFLIHFVGDMHCPMHVGWKSNLGGNTLTVKFFGRLTNLHIVWDHYIISEHLNRSYERSLMKWINELDLKMNTIWKEKQKEWIQCSSINPAHCVDEWATEVAALACDPAYKNVKKWEELGEAYFQKAVPVIEEVIAKSAARLAHLLNWIFLQ